jgi:predicted SAM-dependent methyltransferase
MYAGHVIEHMCGNEALDFLMDCYRLLNDGGLLVLKTPNWEHPYVRHGGFWMDITHVRPYPPQLLMKVLTDIGFSFVRAFAEQAGLQDIVAIGAKAPKDNVSL